MRAFLLGTIGLLGTWFALTAWIVDLPNSGARIGATVLGCGLLALAVAIIRWPSADRCRALALIGCVAVVVGSAGVFGGPTARLNEVAIGALVAFLGFFAGEIARPTSVKAVDRNGMTLAEARTIERQGDALTIKAQLLGAMPSTIYVHPEELWKMIGLLDADAVFSIPRLLLLGWLKARRAPGAPATSGRKST